MRRLPFLVLALLAVGACAWLLLEGEPSAPVAETVERAAPGPTPGGPALRGADGLRGVPGGVAVPRAGVAGLVLAQGAPAEGASVSARPHRDATYDRGAGWTDAFDLLAFVRGRDDQPRDPPSTRTDAQGRFLLEGLALGTWMVEASDASGTARMLVTLEAAGERPFLRLLLEPASAALHGIVLGADGAPWTAEVSAVPQMLDGDGGDPFSASAASPAVRCDAEGRFALSGLLPGRVVVRARLPGGDAVQGPAVMLPFPGEYRLVVPALTRRLTGLCLRAPSGAAVPGAALALGLGEPQGGSAWLHTLKADAAGRFEARVPEATVELLAEAPGLLCVTLSVTKHVNDVRVQLLEGARLSGTVRAKAGGAPCVGARVRLHTDDGAHPEEALTAADGTYVIESARPGAREVYVRGGGWASPGLLSPSDDGLPEDGLAVELPAGAARTYDLVAVPTVTLPGRVLDAQGAVVSGARVSTDLGSLSGGSSWMADNLGDAESRAATDAEGRFTVPDLLPGMRFKLRVRAPERADHLSGPYEAVAGMAPVEVRLPAVRDLLVSVVGAEDGKPVPGCGVRCRVLEGDETLANTTLPTDALGQARFRGLPEGTTTVRAGGGDVPRTPYEEVAAQPGADPRTHTLRVGKGLRIEGRVLDAEKRPVAGANVGAHDAQNNWRGGTSTGPDGSFALRGLPSGTWRVQAWAQGRSSPEPVSVEAGATGVELVLPSAAEAGRTLLVRVLGPDGLPVPAFQVELSTRGSNSSTSGSMGLAALGVAEGDTDIIPLGLLRGDLLLEVYDARGPDGLALDYAPAARALTSLEVLELEVRLEAGRALVGRVLGPDGRPQRGVLVQAWPHRPQGTPPEAGSSDAGGSTYSDAEGRFRLVGLTQRAYGLRPYPSRGLAAPRTPTVASPGGAEVEIRLSASRTVRVLVLDAVGKPLEGASVQAWAENGEEDEEGDWHEMSTDARGVAELERLDPERAYQLTISAEGDEGGFADWVREAWLPADLEVRLQPGNVLAGVVKDAQGRPVAHAALSVEWADSRQTARADDEGRFRIERLPAGPFTLRGHDALSTPLDWGSLPATQVEAGRTDLVLVVARAKETRVLLPEAPAGDHEVHLLAWDAEERRWQPANDLPWDEDLGGVHLRRTAEDQGRYAVSVRIEGQPERLFHAEVPTGAAQVTLRAVPTRVVRCQVLGLPRGEQAQVYALDARGISLSAHTDPTGRCTLVGVPDGPVTYSAWCHVDDSHRYAGSASASSGESVDIPVSLSTDER